MKLTAQQIQHIETRLINDGVKYWDIRIELLDHIVSDVETRLENQENFKKVVQSSFTSLGWTQWEKLEKVVRNRSVLVHKKYKKMFFKEFLYFFKSVKNAIIYAAFLCVYVYLFFHLNFKIFHKVSFGILAVTLLITVYNGIKLYKKANRKSLIINQGGFYLMFSFFILNFISPFIKKDSFFDFSSFTKELILAFYVSIHIIFVYAGYKVFLKTKNEVERMYNELQKL